MKFGFIWMPETIKASGHAVHEITYYHDVWFSNILKRYAKKINKSVPKEKEAQLIFVKDALVNFKKSNKPFIKEDCVFRTVEIFNWNVVEYIIDQLNRDPKAIANAYRLLKLSKKWIPNVDCACSAYALGMISLKALYIMIVHYCDYDYDYCKRDLTPEELAVSVFCRIANSFSLKSEYFDHEYDYDPIEYNTIGLIEKILADVIVMDTDRLPFIL